MECIVDDLAAVNLCIMDNSILKIGSKNGDALGVTQRTVESNTRERGARASTNDTK